jgi:uncharacterized protein
LIRGSAAPVLRALDVEKTLPLLVLPDHHEVRREDVVMRRLAGALAAAQEAGPRDFEDLLLVKGVGPRTMLSLAMAAEIIHGAPCRFSDPARYSLAHGGKDGHPYPVPVKVFDQTIRVLKNAVERSKLGNDDKAFAIKQLDREVRRLEPTAPVPDFDDFVAEEKKHVAEYDGRTVMTHPRARDAKRSGSKAQLTLFGKRR